ncbi:Zinc metalloproteinase nas-4-like protein [Aphelenchoides bicaudatus]|nr:Zinc metalloproteinase nas-4-like protein [Aphelenchoides bicaudatus]
MSLLRVSVAFTLFVCAIINGMPVKETAEALKNKAVFLGNDILIPEEERNFHKLSPARQKLVMMRKATLNKWPNSVVPWMATGFSSDEKSKIRKALQAIESKSCFKFPEAQGSKYKNYVDIKKGAKGDCHAELGYQARVQKLSLGEGCVQPNVVQHEFMHAIGLIHEHQRPDRNNYISVYLQNILPAYKFALEVDQNPRYDPKKYRYDIKSIMHYPGRSAFSKTDKSGNQLITMESKKAPKEIKYNFDLTNDDSEKLKFFCDGNTKPAAKTAGKETPKTSKKTKGAKTSKNTKKTSRVELD